MNEAFEALGLSALSTLAAEDSTATSPTTSVLTVGDPAQPVITLLDVDINYSGNVSTYRWANRGLIYPDNTAYEARVMSAITVSQSGIDAIGIGGRVTATISDILLDDGSSASFNFPAVCNLGTAIGRAAIVKTMPALYDDANRAKSDLGGGNISGATTVFSGYVDGLDLAHSTGRLRIADLSSRLDVPLQIRKFLGTGGVEGSSELTGLYPPVAMGFCFNVTPVSLGNQDFGDGSLPTYMTNGRAVLEHTAVRVRGVEQVKVIGVAPTTGQYRDWPQHGCFQIGSSPDGAVTCDVRGDYYNSVYSGTVGYVIQTMLTDYGGALGSGVIDSTSFGIISAAMAREIGWYHGTDEITLLAALEDIARRTGIWIYGTRTGKIGIVYPDANPGSVVATIEQGHIVSATPVAMPAKLSPPPSSVSIGFARNWTPLTDIAGSVSDANKSILSGQGQTAVAESTTIAAAVAPQKEWKIPGLYRYEADALAHAEALRDWLELGLTAWRITIDRYLGQVNIGDVVEVTSYPMHALSGRSGFVAEWREDFTARQFTMTIIGEQ